MLEIIINEKIESNSDYKYIIRNNTYDYKACMMLFLRKIYFVCHIPKKHIAILIKDSKSIHAKEE